MEPFVVEATPTTLAWSNATPDLYETENVTYGGRGDKVKVPKVEDDKVVSSYSISREYTPESVGSNTICSGLVIKAGNDNIDYSSDLAGYKLWIVGKTSYYNMNGTQMIVYVTGNATGISSISSSSSYVRGGKGKISILTDSAKRFPIYNMNGQKVVDVSVEAGVLQNVSLASGIYVVDGKKIVVR